MTLSAVEPKSFPWFDYARYTFSLGVRSGSRVWLSGHSASEYDGSKIVVKGGMTEQATTAYAKIEAILEGAGLTFADVRRVVEYVTTSGIEHYDEARAVRMETFGPSQPAVCTVVVSRLLRPAAFIEIEVTADAETGDEVVFLPSITAPGPDLQTQAEGVYAKASSMLTDMGLSMANVVKTVDYTTPATLADYKHTGRPRREHLGPVYPAAAGILMDRLQTADTLISLDVTASKAPGAAVNPGWERYAKLTYSPAVKAGSTLWMSGQAALDPSTERAVHPGDVVAQAEYTYENIVAVLREAGLGPEHLVKTIEYVTPAGLERYREVAKVREKILRQPFPASTGCVCAALLRPEFEIEVDPTAVVSV